VTPGLSLHIKKEQGLLIFCRDKESYLRIRFFSIFFDILMLTRQREVLKMIRKIIEIDEEKCDGCGLCISACHEGALALVDGKAKLISESYCDGLGDCLPQCPQGAIRLLNKDVLPYDDEEVKKRMNQASHANEKKHFSGCPGSQSLTINPLDAPTHKVESSGNLSYLGQWPCQIKLVSVNAPYLKRAHLLIAADCTAFAYGNMHRDFMKDKITLIGCPKLDEGDYALKLNEILKHNEIKSVTVLRMEVPCCGGIEMAVKKALIQSQKWIPWNVVTIGIHGNIVESAI
jgi:NAD-dependent dihydropyrimidine dehydrogenase PreA subunit